LPPSVGGVAYRRVARPGTRRPLCSLSRSGNVLTRGVPSSCSARWFSGGLWSKIGAVDVVYAVLSSSRSSGWSRRDRDARHPRPGFATRRLSGLVRASRASRRSVLRNRRRRCRPRTLQHTSVLIVTITVTVAMSVIAHGISGCAARRRATPAGIPPALDRGRAPWRRWRHPRNRSRSASERTTKLRRAPHDCPARSSGMSDRSAKDCRG